MPEDNIAEAALAAERVRAAVLLRAKGAHWTEIARECGYPSPASALRAVGAAMAAATQRAEETADMMRDTAQLRLERLLSDAMSMIAPDARSTYDADGNETAEDDRAVRLRAVDEARRIVGDLAKLQGVDKPAKDAGQDDALTVRIVGIDPADII